MLKRIFLFALTNILVVITISALLRILGVQPYMTSAGINYGSLAAFCLVWGMAGSLISLALSRIMAKWMMGVKVLDEKNAGELDWVVRMVHDLARRAQLPAMPQVGVYESPDVNAFATGPTQSRALVAVSTGILHAMNREELEGVIGHEIAHIKNGDMITMTLIQGVINAFVMFFSRVIAFALSQNAKEENRHLINMVVTIVLEICFSILGMLVVAWFSRQREFRADAGSAKICGSRSMVGALQVLQKVYGRPQVAAEPASMAVMKISGKQGGFLSLFSTHPPLEQRIAALEKLG